MGEAEQLINALRELNSTQDKSVARLTPSLIGLFGSPRMFDLFLDELDTALKSGSVPVPLRKRAANLSNTFIPQVAGYNNISAPVPEKTTSEQLLDIRVDTPSNRNKGVQAILSALRQILAEINSIP